MPVHRLLRRCGRRFQWRAKRLTGGLAALSPRLRYDMNTTTTVRQASCPAALLAVRRARGVVWSRRDRRAPM